MVLSTDAHAPGDLARTPYGLDMARRGWVEARDVLNTRPVDDIIAFRRSRLRHHGIAVPAPPVGATRQERDAVDPNLDAASDTGNDRDTADDLESLIAALEQPDEALRARLQQFVTSGDDPTLETALRRQSDNPLQRAFELIVA